MRSARRLSRWRAGGRSTTVFERLAHESGAECYFPITTGGVKRAIETVAKELQTQYTLAYYPESSAKAYRHIQVKVRVHGLKVFTRRGFSTTDAGVHFSADVCAISPQEHCTVIWAKDRFTLSRADIHPQHEPILYGWPEGPGHYWCGRRDQGTVWNLAKPRVNELHPTQKPVELIEL